MLNFAVFSDIHGNIEALETIIDDIKAKGITEIFYLGDAMGLGFDSLACFQLIKSLNIHYLRGGYENYIINHAKKKFKSKMTTSTKSTLCALFSDEDKKAMSELPSIIKLELNHYKFTFMHFPDLLNDDLQTKKEIQIKKLYDDYFIDNSDDYIFLGHIPTQATYCFKHSILTCVGSSGDIEDNHTYYMYGEFNDGKFQISKIQLTYDNAKYLQRLYYS